ncbi:MAG: OsmC family peroxiredoxin [Acidobacteriota bacterium]
MADRKGRAVWRGGIMDGMGSIGLGSGLFEGAYSFASRMGEDPGTNPEELLGASLAGCYAMALNATLKRQGKPATEVTAEANVHLGKEDSGFVIKGIDLTATASVHGLEDADFQTIAEDVKSTCPISKALGGTKITLHASLKR